jgi:hypothetical protein
MKGILKVIVLIIILFFGFKLFVFFAKRALFLGILAVVVIIAYRLLWKRKGK